MFSPLQLNTGNLTRLLAAQPTPGVPGFEHYITADRTYTVGIGGGFDFDEPGACSEFLQQYRIAPGVTVTITVADGTYSCTKSVLGHVDGQRIFWTNSGRKLPAFTSSASGTGAEATVHFTGSTYTFPVGSTVIITQMVPTGYNGKYTVTASAPGQISFASATTGAQTVSGKVHLGFDHLDALWTWTPTGIDPASQAAAAAVAEPMMRAMYSVVLEYTTLPANYSIAFMIENNHSGDWEGCPSMFINMGTVKAGVSTGSHYFNGSGAGGVGIFNKCCFFGFDNVNMLADYGGVINFNDGFTLFATSANMRSDFHGGFIALGVTTIGGGEFGWRGNHGGYLYAGAGVFGSYVHGNQIGLESTSAPSMSWGAASDIQYNFYGVYVEWGGQSMCYHATIKNNMIQQVGALGGICDIRNVDMQSTATFNGDAARLGVTVYRGGVIDVSSPADPNLPGVVSIISGHGIADCQLDTTGEINVLGSTYGLARDYNKVVAPNVNGYLLPPNLGPAFGADAGSTDDYVISIPGVSATYVGGMTLTFKAATANTGAATLAVSGGTARSIVKGVSTTLANSDILAGMYCQVVYDDSFTRWVLLNPRTL